MGEPYIIRNRRFNLSVYTVMHFLVDLSCIFYLMGMVNMRLAGVEQWTLAAIVYNAFAFALPMLLGFFADLLGENAAVSCLGCLLILLNYLIIPDPWTSVALIGIGNGLFHIGGGRQVLQDAGPKYAPSGVFIASGAMGVYLGRQMSGAFRQIYYQSMWILLLLCVLLLAVMSWKQWKSCVRSHPSHQHISVRMLGLSLLLFLVVIIRSYYGFAAKYSWNQGFWMGFIFTLCVVAGKFGGGFLADRFGVMAASGISLGGAGIAALFAANSPLLGCISILLFNMTMPITLTLLTQLWKELPGFAFGTLMMALFLGTLPSMVWKVTWMATPAGLFGLCMISLALLLAAEYRCSRTFKTV